MTNEVVTAQDKPAQALTHIDNNFQVFAGLSAFESAQRMAKALASSTLVPKEYRGNLSNCLIALEIGMRSKASPLMVMQNLTVIHGRPSWSSQFIISAINTSGKFSPLRFRITEDESERVVEYTELVWDESAQKNKPVNKTQKIRNKVCVAYAVEKDTGEVLESPPVSLEIAIKEGWFNKSGSKWQTMPDLMLRYRAAAFFGRLYAPEILMGMKATEEILDAVEPIDVTPVSAAEKLNDKYLAPEVVEQEKQPEAATPVNVEPVAQVQEKETAFVSDGDASPPPASSTPKQTRKPKARAEIPPGFDDDISDIGRPQPTANPLEMPVPRSLMKPGGVDWEGWIDTVESFLKENPGDVADFRKANSAALSELHVMNEELFFKLEAKLQAIMKQAI